LAAEVGYWAASTKEEHVTRLHAQNARYDEHEDQGPSGDKWKKMMGAWVHGCLGHPSQEIECAGAKRPPVGLKWAT